MAITRLGWDILSANSDRLTGFRWVTGKVRGGDHAVVLDYLARRFNSEVERIDVSKSWGFSARPVRGFAGIPSEHSAGVAVDFNAPDHWLGLVHTFNRAKRRAIAKILRSLKGSVRWGGNYAGRKDEMHFELQGGNALIKRVADKIRAGKLPASGKGSGAVKPAGSVKPSKPKPSKQPTDYKDLRVDGDFGPVTVKALQIVMRAIGTYSRAVDGKFAKYTKRGVQKWLADLGFYRRAIDGRFGHYSVEALQKFLAHKGELDTSRWLIDGKFGPATVRAFQSYLNTQNGIL